MPELRVEAVIFDMDGVVIDSGDVYAKHWRRWAAEHGFDYDADIAHIHPGRPPLATVRVVAPHLDAVSESARFNAALDADGGAEEIEAMPGAAALLAGLPPDRWAIATSAYRRIAREWLSYAGLPEPMALVTVDDVENGKPAPDPYLRAAELLGRDPRRCLVVEDAPAGISAGKAAGATVLAVQTSHAPADLAQADHRTAGLHTISVRVEVDGLLVSWQPTSD
jgi:mannitol-1-/sugar-/sorbitol-6-phosphatase